MTDITYSTKLYNLILLFLSEFESVLQILYFNFSTHVEMVHKARL